MKAVSTIIVSFSQDTGPGAGDFINDIISDVFLDVPFPGIRTHIFNSNMRLTKYISLKKKCFDSVEKYSEKKQLLFFPFTGRSRVFDLQQILYSFVHSAFVRGTDGNASHLDVELEMAKAHAVRLDRRFTSCVRTAANR